jgi:rhombotail lipoprotein
LRSGRGFQTVEQVARLYHLDVMALVSYDQVAHADDTKSSILYWTIVGAYFVKGSKNDVQTFVDTAIFDVKSNKLLFRAPGINRIEATSTLVNSTEEMRKARENSFSLAMSDMTNNLNAELDKFKERIKKDKSVTVSYRPGYGGGGAFGPQMIIMLTVFFLVKRLFIQKKMESS